MDISDYSPAADARRFDAGHAARPEHLRGSRRDVDRRGGRRAGDRGARPRSDDAADRGARGVRRDGGHARATLRVAAPLVCFRSTGSRSARRELAGERIVVSMRDDNVRVSPHLYNTEDDVDPRHRGARAPGATSSRDVVAGRRRL